MIMQIVGLLPVISGGSKSTAVPSKNTREQLENSKNVQCSLSPTWRPMHNFLDSPKKSTYSTIIVREK